MRPEPAPMTWMIDAHSAFLSMSRDRGLLHVEDLAADRQQRLVLGVAGELRRAERRVALDDEQLGAVARRRAAVGELGRQRRGLERVLAALRLLVLRGRRCGSSSRRRLVEHRAACALSSRLVDVKRPSARSATTWRRSCATAGVPSTSLVWPSNCGSGSRTVTHRGQALEDVVLARPSSSPTLSSWRALS